MASIMGKIKAICRSNKNLPLDVVLQHLNRVLRGWTAYFRFGVSFATFSYLRAYVWQRVTACIRRKHPKMNCKQLRRRYFGGRWWPVTATGTTLFNPTDAGTARYYYRRAQVSSPWPEAAAA
ncbi:group II intron maturase-specific domain-containing protein [Nocardia camponoti]|uniref:Group II intron maturase-specific domain-containing protein n=1 Tax=Nocardia camponoti TaxID=1616106 RepID=A0A917QRA5_9NOCA|nr:group II intron maturase-specific domain-containing protein [Nocardia camponoti]GGK63338.1 hypothetical protein GCM10011591_39520 [Nocardia camponoti]